MYKYLARSKDWLILNSPATGGQALSTSAAKFDDELIEVLRRAGNHNFHRCTQILDLVTWLMLFRRIFPASGELTEDNRERVDLFAARVPEIHE